jgi:hypothetical protein
MKRIKLLQTGITAAALIFATATVAHATVGYSITESSSGLATDIPGAVIGGTQDNWTVTLAAGYSWNFPGGSTLYLAEPENSGLINILTVSAANNLVLTWQSDVQGTTTAPSSVTSQVLNTPNGAVYSVTVTDSGDKVPDGGATIGLLGLALVGLFAIRHPRREMAARP